MSDINIESCKKLAKKKEQLYFKQKKMLELFLEKNAISKEEFDAGMTKISKVFLMEEDSCGI